MIFAPTIKAGGASSIDRVSMVLQQFHGPTAINVEELRQIAEAGERHHQTLTAVQAQLTQLTAVLAPGPVVALRQDTSPGAFAAEPFLNDQLDDLRDRGSKLPPQEALANAERFLAALPSTAAPVIQFRARAILGHFHLRLDDREAAKRCFDEAFDFAPNDRRAIANRALMFWLAGDPAEAHSFGLAAFIKDPENEWAGGYAIQAASDIPGIDDPLAALPKALRDHPIVLTALIIFLRRRERIPEWWERAEAAALRHPEHDPLRQAAALAVVDEVSRDQMQALIGVISDDQRARLRPAVACLDAAWQEERAHLTDPHSQAAQHLVAAMMGAHLLGDRARAVELATVVADEQLRDGHVLAMTAQTVLNHDEDDLLARLVDLGQDDPRVRFFAGAAALRQGDWQAAGRALSGALIPEAERAMSATIIRIAEYKAGGRTPSAAQYAEALRLRRGCARAAVMIAREARLDGHTGIAERAYVSAVTLARQDASFAARTMSASLAAGRGRWRDVIALLDGRIPRGANVEAWRMLAAAHGNEWPKRHRNRRFVDELPPEVRDPFVLAHKAVILSHLRDTTSALALVTDLLADDPHDALLWLTRIHSLRALAQSGALDQALAEIDLPGLHGASVHRVTLIHSVARSGDMARAIDAAYALLRELPADPDAASGYVGLFTLHMVEPRRLDLRPEPDVAGPGTWVEITSTQGVKRDFLIDDGGDFLGIAVVAPQHVRAQRLAGLKVGQSFELDRPFIGPERWTLSALKSRTLHAFHVLSNEFPERYPGRNAIVSFQLQDGDVTPIVEMAQRHGAAIERSLRTYADETIPLAVAARAMGENVLAFARRLRASGRTVKVCAGFSGEVYTAWPIAIDGRGAGAVLDPYTACCAAAADLLEPLKAYFGTLYTPVSTLGLLEDDRLLAIGADAKAVDIEAAIREHCRVEAALYPDDDADICHTVARTLGARLLDAGLLARDRGAILISEDVVYRAFVGSTLNVATLWLQPVMDAAVTGGTLGTDGYVAALAELARRGHHHLSVDVDLLLAALDRYADADLADFAALAAQVGTPDANRRAHCALVIGFLSHAWNIYAGRDALRIKRSTGIMLTNLLRCYPCDAWGQVIADIYSAVRGRGFLRLYLVDWARGHFLLQAKAEAASVPDAKEGST